MFSFTSFVKQCRNPEPTLSKANRTCHWGRSVSLGNDGRVWEAAEKRFGGSQSAWVHAAKDNLSPRQRRHTRSHRGSSRCAHGCRVYILRIYRARMYTFADAGLRKRIALMDTRTSA